MLKRTWGKSRILALVKVRGFGTPLASIPSGAIFPLLSMALAMFVSMVWVLTDGLRMIAGALLELLGYGDGELDSEGRGASIVRCQGSGLLSSSLWKWVSFPFLLLLFLTLWSCDERRAKRAVLELCRDESA